jgi:fatty acid desaturase
MTILNLLFFALIISLVHNFYNQYNTIFLKSFTFLFLFELIVIKIFNRLKSNQINTDSTNIQFKFNTLTNIDPSINSSNPYITNDKNTKHIVSAYDAMAKRNEYLFRIKYFDNFLVKLLNDKRDIVTAWTFINLITVSLPLIFLNLYFSSVLPSICAPLTFFFNTFTFTDRFILGLHYSSHRPIWKDKASFMNYIPTVFIAPFFGLPSGNYWTHHILMHHRHNNEVGRDLSSTEPYQRDNFFHFINYWLRFLIGIWFELPLFALKYGKSFSKSWNGLFNCGIFLATRILFSSFIHLYLTYLSIVYIPWAGTWLIAMPIIISSFLLMFGNWSQHMFIDPERPWNNFVLSYTCMNSPSQQRSFNDGYHINHHIAPLCHWADLPADFERCVRRFEEEESFCFSGIDNFCIGINVFIGRLDKLTEHMINPCTGKPWKVDTNGNIDRTACIIELKRRLKPVSNLIYRPFPNHRGMKFEDQNYKR